MSNLTKPPILDDTGQDILTALGAIKQNLPQGGGSNGYAPTDATETTLADDDKVPFYDTSATAKRNSTWANIKAKLKAYFDNIYSTFSGAYADLTGKPTLGTAAEKDVPSSGDASTTQVVMGSDTRLSDSRNAADVYAWAKASTKPSYTASEVGALPTSGGEMTGTITTPADNSNGIIPKTDRTGILGSITKWFNLLHVQDIRTQAIKFFGTTTTSASTNGYTLYASGTPTSNVNINVADLLTKPELDGTVFVEKTWAEYQALSEAQKNDGKVEYFITDLDDIDYAVQDDPTATDLVNDEVPTGGTIENWSKQFQKVYKKQATNVNTITITITDIGSSTYAVPFMLTGRDWASGGVQMALGCITISKGYSTGTLAVPLILHNSINGMTASVSGNNITFTWANGISYVEFRAYM